MKYQALFYQKNNEKYSRLSSAVVVIGALKVNFRFIGRAVKVCCNFCLSLYGLTIIIFYRRETELMNVTVTVGGRCHE